GEADCWTADVSDEAAVNSAVAGVEARYGAVTVLFNHSGTIFIKPFLETTVEEWDWLHAVNVRSMFLQCFAALIDLDRFIQRH
ncbi:SDR family NAD(P)-dependent oxidoreductase, partial [Rhizobium ruizarguesonis]